MSSILAADESVLFIDRKGRQYLRRLVVGKTIQLRGGKLPCDDVIGLSDGSRVVDVSGERFLVLRPTYADLIPSLPRAAQVIYPKDVGPILMWGDIKPGVHVLESGVGSGALSMALLRAIGSEGRLTSYEIREDFAEAAQKNVARFHGPAPQWTVKLADVYEGIEERDLDRAIFDLPEPWKVLDPLAEAMRPGGVFVGYVPTVLQLKQLLDTLEDHAAYGRLDSFETMQRHWHNRERSIRPTHRMVAHTGFLTIARRLA